MQSLLLLCILEQVGDSDGAVRGACDTCAKAPPPLQPVHTRHRATVTGDAQCLHQRSLRTNLGVARCQLTQHQLREFYWTNSVQYTLQWPTPTHNRPLYKGHFSRPQIILFPIVSIHFEPPRRGQPLHKGRNSCIDIVPNVSEALLYIIIYKIWTWNGHGKSTRETYCATVVPRLV